MRNTVGGCYTCDECGFGINDLVYRGGGGKECVDGLQKEGLATPDTNTATTTVDGLTAPSNTSKATIPGESVLPDRPNYGWARQGWQCPKCGAILSPDTPFCPFCSRQTFTPTVTCGIGSGEYVNPNVSYSVSEANTLALAEVLLEENKQIREAFNKKSEDTVESDMNLIKAAKKCAIRDLTDMIVSHYPHSDSVVSTIEKEAEAFLKALSKS